MRCDKYLVVDLGISKYLRHSDAVASKHYDFGVIEQSARNRAAIVSLVGGKSVLLVLTNTKHCHVCTRNYCHSNKCLFDTAVLFRSVQKSYSDCRESKYTFIRSLDMLVLTLILLLLLFVSYTLRARWTKRNQNQRKSVRY